VIRVFTIRHGESESNAGLPSADPGSAPLTPDGHRQARQIARVLADVPALIVTSLAYFAHANSPSAQESMRKLADCGGISPEGADITDNIRYLQDLADEIDPSPRAILRFMAPGEAGEPIKA